MAKRKGDGSLMTFAAGVWSPKLRGRVDLAKTSAALRTCNNFIVRQSGALRRRPGSQFINYVNGFDPAPPPDFLQYQSQVVLEAFVPLDVQVFL